MVSSPVFRLLGAVVEATGATSVAAAVAVTTAATASDLVATCRRDCR